MPKTQREWFEGQFFEWNVTTSLLSDQIRKRKQLAKKLTSAWPSSPQGLAAKALVEAAEQVTRRLRDASDNHYAMELRRGMAGILEQATEAARKAGLTWTPQQPANTAIASGLCVDGCPPCSGCGVHMDAWWFYRNGGYCEACLLERKKHHA